MTNFYEITAMSFSILKVFISETCIHWLFEQAIYFCMSYSFQHYDEH